LGKLLVTLRDHTRRGFALTSQWPLPSAPSRAVQNPAPDRPRIAALWAAPGRIDLDDVLDRPACAVLDRGCPPLDPAAVTATGKVHDLETRARTPRPSGDPATPFRAGIRTRCTPSHHVSAGPPRSPARASGAALTISQSGDSSGSHPASARRPPRLLQAGFQQVNSHPGFFKTHPDRRRSRMVGSRSAVRFRKELSGADHGQEGDEL
jgi:hypothetical protein